MQRNKILLRSLTVVESERGGFGGRKDAGLGGEIVQPPSFLGVVDIERKTRPETQQQHCAKQRHEGCDPAAGSGHCTVSAAMLSSLELILSPLLEASARLI